MTSTQALMYDPNATYEVESTDVEYRREGDTVWLARVHRPVGAGPFPTLLDVHGGAWANGDRLMNESSDLGMARSGLVVAAIDFRTSLAAPHPAAQEDINYAIRWLKLHASEFGGTAESLGAAGWSSGGHQVMLAAMRPEQYGALPLEGDAGVDASLAYVIMGWPVIDPLSRYRLAQGRDNEPLMANHLRYFGSEEGMTEASPPHILQRGEPVLMPPTLLVQGALDESLPRMMAEEFAEAYSLAGGVIELAKYPGAPHGFLREPGPASDRALALIKSFIARNI
ncbi:MAG: alpha/beta hydrolase fold domain-containing protein [Dehalococcoidia bacterium]|nr:alpha/beta hydrolase fold domain-containing protein [Dehalococcoidia bacterium]